VELNRKTGTVLLVEDEDVLRRMVRRVLVRHGYTVIEACDGQAAELLFEEYAASIDVLLTDVIMPHMGGVDLARKLLAIRPGIRLIFMTGHADAELLGAFLDDGAVLLRKPFTNEALASEIHSALRET
jgi:CheY-like chemotaxis protein